jgi:hypothetical protein
MLSVVMLSVIMLSVVMLSVVMLSVVMLSVIMLSVVAPVGMCLTGKNRVALSLQIIDNGEFLTLV